MVAPDSKNFCVGQCTELDQLSRMSAPLIGRHRQVLIVMGYKENVTVGGHELKMTKSGYLDSDADTLMNDYIYVI